MDRSEPGDRRSGASVDPMTGWGRQSWPRRPTFSRAGVRLDVRSSGWRGHLNSGRLAPGEQVAPEQQPPNPRAREQAGRLDPHLAGGQRCLGYWHRVVRGPGLEQVSSRSRAGGRRRPPPARGDPRNATRARPADPAGGRSGEGRRQLECPRAGATGPSAGARRRGRDGGAPPSSGRRRRRRPGGRPSGRRPDGRSRSGGTRRRAFATITGERSTPSTCGTRSARVRARPPAPQPTLTLFRVRRHAAEQRPVVPGVVIPVRQPHLARVASCA